MRVYLAFLAMFVGMTANWQAVAQDKDGACSFRRLEIEFIERAVTDAIFRYKLVHHTLPPLYVQESMRHEISDKFVQRVPNILSALSVRAETKALIYGKDGRCVWLVGKSGILAAEPFQIDAATNLLVPLWTSLGVSAQTRGLQRRKRDGSCEAIGQLPKETTAEASETLARAAAILLPDPISKILSEETAPNARLLIMPTSNLRKLPFAALPVKGISLIDKFVPLLVGDLTQMGYESSVYFPPKSIDEVLRSFPSSISERLNGRDDLRSTSLVVGNPDLKKATDFCWPPLPGAESEAKAVAVALKTEPMIGAAASFEAVFGKIKSQANRLSIVYMATHGVSDVVNPADGSFLALSGRYLRAADLRKLTLGAAPLVVMSACETGLGKEFPFGVFGIADAWRFAGASQIVMSLWRVDDAATQRLMENFVADLNITRGAEFSLAAAMRALKREFPNPAAWAAFTLYGLPSHGHSDWLNLPVGTRRLE